MLDERQQIIVYLLRKTNLTHKEITGEFDWAQIVSIYNECRFQESLDDWKLTHNAASIMTMIANVNKGKHGRAYHTKDFIADPPQREGVKEELPALAESMGLRVPSKGGAWQRT